MSKNILLRFGGKSIWDKITELIDMYVIQSTHYWSQKCQIRLYVVEISDENIKSANNFFFAKIFISKKDKWLIWLFILYSLSVLINRHKQFQIHSVVKSLKKLIHFY